MNYDIIIESYELQLVTEGFIEKVKDNWNRFVEYVKKLFDKLYSSITKLFKRTDKIKRYVDKQQLTFSEVSNYHMFNSPMHYFL